MSKPATLPSKSELRAIADSLAAPRRAAYEQQVAKLVAAAVEGILGAANTGATCCRIYIGKGPSTDPADPKARPQWLRDLTCDVAKAIEAGDLRRTNAGEVVGYTCKPDCNANPSEGVWVSWLEITWPAIEPSNKVPEIPAHALQE